MNKKIEILFKAAVCCLGISNISFATDYTYTGNVWGFWVSGYNNGNLDAPVTSGWTNNGNVLQGAPTYEDSFNYTGTSYFGIHIMGWDLANLQGGDSMLYVKSVNINSTGGVGIGTFESDPVPGQSYPNWLPASISVKEDFIITTSGQFTISEPSKEVGIKYIRVGGNFDISGVAGGTTIGFMPSTIYTESNPSMVIGGVLKLGSTFSLYNGNVFTPVIESLNPVIQLGGLSGNNSYIIHDDKYVDSSTFIFKTESGKTFAGGTFVGGMVDKWRQNGNTYPITTFTLIMDDTSNGGVQNIVINKSGTGNTEIAPLSAAYIKAEIRNGRMGLGNASSGDSFTDIKMTGGELIVLDEFGFNSAFGRIKADGFTWDAGTISIYTDGENAGYIDMSSGSLFNIGASAGKFKLILDEAVILADGSFDFSDLVIVSGDSLNFSTDDLQRMVDLSSVFYNGSKVDAVLNFELISDYLVVSGSGVIPEPSVIALAFGILSLSAALVRRGKCR